METANRTTDRILIALAKRQFDENTVTGLAGALKITRQGLWKALRKLEKDKLIILKSVGIGRTGIITLKLNWDNSLAEKMLSVSLIKESLEYDRWTTNFKELEGKVIFLILFGSVLNNPKEARDIDIMAVVDNKNFKVVEETVIKIQRTMMKKIHFIDITDKEFFEELNKPNKAHIDAVRKGVVLFGHDNFIKFIKKL